MADPTSLSPADVSSLQRAVGNRAVQRLLAQQPVAPDPTDPPGSGLVLQTKLTVGPANDAYEREADQIAQGVMRHIDETAVGDRLQRVTVGYPGASLNNEEDEEVEGEAQATTAGASVSNTIDDDDDDKLRRMPSTPQPVGLKGGEVNHQLESGISQARGAGQPLHGGVRASMEDAFQADFSRVRVHSNRQSDSLNRSLSARAFTTGQDLFFKQGEYNPHSTSGKSLLAHELTHVVQQNGAAVRRKPNKDARRAYAAPVRTRTTDERPQRAVIDYATQERNKWQGRNTAAQVALAPLGGVYGAGKGAYKGYKGIYERLRGEKGANASTGRKIAAGIGSFFLGSLALPFTMGWGALRGAVSGIANPLISGGRALGGAIGGIPKAVRTGLGQFRNVPQEQRGQVEGSSPLPETEEETRSRLTALGSRRAPIAPPNAPGDQGAQDLRQQRSVALDRGENDIATTGLNVGNYAMSGVGAAAAGGRSLTGWSSGLTDTNWNSGLTGATGAFAGLGASAGVLGTGAALIDAGAGFNQSLDSTQSGGDRAQGLGQGLSSTGDALRQSSTAAFNIASLTGNAAAAAAATLVAGGAGVAMGVIDVLRGATGALTANKRHDALLAIIDQTEREATLTQGDKLRIINAARQAAATQRTRIQTGAATAGKGVVTIAGGALLIAAGLTNPVGWALLGGAALIGGIYALYKLYQKSKHKRQVATRELGIQSWRDRWKAKKKFIEDTSDWGSADRRRRMKDEAGEDPLEITLRSQGYESAGHFYARYIKVTAQTLYDNAVAGPEPDPQNRADDLRGEMVKVIEAMGLRIDRTKPTHTPTVKRLAQSLDN